MEQPRRLPKNRTNKIYKRIQRFKHARRIPMHPPADLLADIDVSDMSPDEIEQFILREHQRRREEWNQYIREHQPRVTYLSDNDLSDRDIDNIEDVERQFANIVSPNIDNYWVFDHPGDNPELEEQINPEVRMHPRFDNFISPDFRHFRIRILMPYTQNADHTRIFNTDVYDLYKLVFRRLFYTGRLRNVPHPRFGPDDIKVFIVNCLCIECVFKKWTDRQYYDFYGGLQETNRDNRLLYIKASPLCSHFKHIITYQTVEQDRIDHPTEISRCDVIKKDSVVFRYSPSWYQTKAPEYEHIQALIIPTCYQRHDFPHNQNVIMNWTTCTSVYYDISPPESLFPIGRERQNGGWLPMCNKVMVQSFEGCDMCFGLVDVIIDNNSWLEGLPEYIPSEFITAESHFREPR